MQLSNFLRSTVCLSTIVSGFVQETGSEAVRAKNLAADGFPSLADFGYVDLQQRAELDYWQKQHQKSHLSAGSEAGGVNNLADGAPLSNPTQLLEQPQELAYWKDPQKSTLSAAYEAGGANNLAADKVPKPKGFFAKPVGKFAIGAAAVAGIAIVGTLVHQKNQERAAGTSPRTSFRN